jgi:hypothetical protein
MWIAAPARACDVTQRTIVFPNFGTHVTWFCKATSQEQVNAVNAVMCMDCIAGKIREHGNPPIISEATDVVPYWFTLDDANKSGPILDVRLTMTRKGEPPSYSVTGLRALAVGRKNASGFDFVVSEPQRYTRDCTESGCVESYENLCPPKP